ncbi:TetR family transcriptional regulator [Streptomyces sp. MAR4 CNX-425]|uniref:TetR/AcrR family transcriptional regulator n=1 Tax=Streptomyces sp. MAR4 CNX-425 TaxID=3406343 RepID=UPI003B503613
MHSHENAGETAPGEERPDPPRLAWRKEMRERVLAAAHELTCAAGWDQVSISAVAERAEVSRPSVYKEFGNRAGLGRALVVRETRSFLDGVVDALGPADRHPRAGLEGAVLFALTEAEHNPLVRAVITAARRGSDSLLPYLTARTDPVFDAAQHILRAWLTERFPACGEEDIDVATDLIVRMTISHLVLPTWPPPTAAERLSRAALRALGET